MLKLNIGCGGRVMEGYTNIDLRQTKPSVVVGDIRNLPCADNSADEIYARDCYEHVSFHESEKMLKHWVKKLKPGGKLFIQTPNIEGLIKNIQKQTEPEGIRLAIRKIFGGQDYKYNYHYTCGHPVLMEHYLRNAGITGEIKMTSKGTNMTIIAFK